MNQTYRTEIEVRGYELDSFGHVNHAQYISYFEHARWKLLEQEHITLETFRQWQASPVIADLSIRYRRPAFLGEHLVIETVVTELGKTDFRFAQKIFRSAELICEAQIHAVMVNPQGRPTELPAAMRETWGKSGAASG